MQTPPMINELIAFITKGNAHVTFEEATDNIPKNARTTVPDGLPYSIWQLVEHVRIAQKDIVDFSKSSQFHALKWPDDYWPENQADVTDEQWEESLAKINSDQKAFFELLQDENNDLFKPFPWGDGQTLFREALLIGDHNAYHTAEIVVIRRLLNCWK